MIDPQAISVAQKALGRQLSRLRKAADLTQHDLATMILTSRSTVANVETGHSRGSKDFWTRADRCQADEHLARSLEVGQQRAVRGVERVDERVDPIAVHAEYRDLGAVVGEEGSVQAGQVVERGE